MYGFGYRVSILLLYIIHYANYLSISRIHSIWSYTFGLYPQFLFFFLYLYIFFPLPSTLEVLLGVTYMYLTIYISIYLRGIPLSLESPFLHIYVYMCSFFSYPIQDPKDLVYIIYNVIFLFIML